MTDLKLLHLHLPKTGGSALRHFFIKQLGDAVVSPPLQGIPLSEALQRWKHAAVISGHFVARQGDQIPSDRFAITALRNPIDRFLSEYFYKRFDMVNLLVDARQRASDLDTYIQDAQMSTTQPPSVQLEMLYPLGTDKQSRLSADEKLTASIEAINRMVLVGIQEEMEDFCAMLSAKLQCRPGTADHINVTSRRLKVENITAAQRRNVETLLEPELELYEYARSRFKRDRRRFIAYAGITGHQAAPLGDTNGSPAKIEAFAAPVNQDFGDRRCEITGVQVTGRVSGPGQAMTGEMMDIVFHVNASQPLDHVNAGIAIKDELDCLVFGTNSLLLGDVYSITSGSYVIRFTTLNRLGPGTYTIDAALMPTSSHYDGCFHWRHAAATFSVPAYATQHFEGNVLLDVNIDIESASDEAVWCRKLPVNDGILARSFGNVSKMLSSFNSCLDVMSAVDTVECQSDLLLQVRLVNQGTEQWPSQGRYPVKLSYRWLDEDGTVVVNDGVRSDLPGDHEPGTSSLICMHVRTPDRPGRFYLAASLVQEHVAWFIDSDGTNGRLLPITVV